MALVAYDNSDESLHSDSGDDDNVKNHPVTSSSRSNEGNNNSADLMDYHRQFVVWLSSIQDGAVLKLIQLIRCCCVASDHYDLETAVYQVLHTVNSIQFEMLGVSNAETECIKAQLLALEDMIKEGNDHFLKQCLQLA